MPVRVKNSTTGAGSDYGKKTGVCASALRLHGHRDRRRLYGPTLNVILSQQTHPLQITDPPRTNLCRPRLEQYIVFQPSSSSTPSIQMS